MLLEKILQSQGFGSKKHCQNLIKQGAVTVNGAVITDLKFNSKPENLQFTVFGDAYCYRERIYLALHKPAGYECSHDTQYHHSVFDLFPQHLLTRGLQGVGRLDQDTTGLLLLTDDGQFLQALTHPKKHVPKTYQVTTADKITAQQLQALQQGVELRNEKGLFQATQVQQLNEYVLQMTIHQGVYHQVKRMLAAVGNKVESLHRLSVGDLCLTNLAEGKWCYLNEAQISAARQCSTVTENNERSEIHYL